MKVQRQAFYSGTFIGNHCSVMLEGREEFFAMLFEKFEALLSQMDAATRLRRMQRAHSALAPHKLMWDTLARGNHLLRTAASLTASEKDELDRAERRLTKPVALAPSVCILSLRIFALLQS